MIASDAMLPAAPHLVGPDALDLLRAAVASADGRLLEARTVQVQYRPGADLVVRYDAAVSWHGQAAKAETLLAGITAAGAHPGALPLEAGDLTAGVWRYPFDPSLPGLVTAVTPRALAGLLEGIIGGPLRLDVRAYRPVRRAVVRVRGADQHEVYVKVVRPAEAPRIVAAHRALRRAGLPVPEVLRCDPDAGLLVLCALPGASLRDVLLGSTRAWPSGAQLAALLRDLAAVDVGAGPGFGSVDPAAMASEVAHNVAGHAEVGAAILPDERGRLDRIIEAVREGVRATAEPVTIHGDLYEAQLMVEAGRLSGLLDLDDVRLGHPLDDVAILLGHLRILRPEPRRHREHLARYRDGLRASLAGGHDPAELDLRTAAVLVGLATGPFRAQSDAWEREVRRRIRAATRLSAAAGEKTLRRAS